MAAITSLIAAGSLALGAVSMVQQKMTQARDQRRMEAAAKQQKIKAQEAMKLKGPSEEDPEIKIGADDDVKPQAAGSNTKGTSTRTSSTGVKKSKVFGGAGSASKIGGL